MRIGKILVDRGEGLDYQKAMIRLKRAADSGLAESYLYLGQCYEMTENYFEAEKWYTKGIESNDPLCMNELAKMNCFTLFDESKKNIHLFKRAAKLNEVQAINNLGVCYIKGFAVKQNDLKALVQFEMAEEYGLAEGAFNVGEFYRVKEKNNKEALKHFKIAEKLGLHAAKARIESLVG